MLPFPSKRAAAFADIPDEKWNDWRWQLSHRLNSIEDFEQVLTLTKSERKALSQPGLFRVDITPYFASLIDPDDPQDPVRRQIIPTADEITTFHGRNGRLPGGRRALPRPRAGSSLSRSGLDAGHHPVRQLLPLLHPLPDRGRPHPDLLIQGF